MSETQEQRIARLALKAVPSASHAFLQRTMGGWHEVVVQGGHIEQSWSYVLCMVVDQPHSLDAIDALICMLAGEPPRWAVELATAWRQRGHSLQHDHEGDEYNLGTGRSLNDAAVELLEAAKGGAR